MYTVIGYKEEGLTYYGDHIHSSQLDVEFYEDVKSAASAVFYYLKENEENSESLEKIEPWQIIISTPCGPVSLTDRIIISDRDFTGNGDDIPKHIRADVREILSMARNTLKEYILEKKNKKKLLAAKIRADKRKAKEDKEANELRILKQTLGIKT